MLCRSTHCAALARGRQGRSLVKGPLVLAADLLLLLGREVVLLSVSSGVVCRRHRAACVSVLRGERPQLVQLQTSSTNNPALLPVVPTLMLKVLRISSGVLPAVWNTVCTWHSVGVRLRPQATHSRTRTHTKYCRLHTRALLQPQPLPHPPPTTQASATPPSSTPPQPQPSAHPPLIMLATVWQVRSSRPLMLR
jgi:hypothetical protein